MKRTSIFSSALITFLLVLSCGGSEEPQRENGETDTGISHLELVPVDTIGVELGDSNYVFGRIVRAELDSRGNILVLDMSTMNLRKFDPRGEFIDIAGGSGTGPGEFQMPRGMTVLGDDRVLVSDMAGGAVEVFDDSMVWRGDITGFFPRPPYDLKTAGDSAFVGMVPAFDREEGLMGYSLARYEESSEPAVVYLEEMRPFDPSRIGPLGQDDNPLFTSDSRGRVYVAEPRDDEISVTCYDAGGNVLCTIAEPVDRAEKTAEELAMEEEEFQEFTSRMGGRGGRFSGADISFEPDPYRNAVLGLGVDSFERLWVRLGSRRYPFWNVYDPEGVLLFTASLQTDDPDIDQMTVNISENGITAWIADPVYWPRVFVVETPLQD